MKTLVLILSFSLFNISASAQFFSNCKKEWLPLEKLSCPYKTQKIESMIGEREVAFSVPKGWAPWNGWPVAIIFQGSFFKVEFERLKALPFGAYNEIRLIQKLLDNGFAVIAPRAFTSLAWQTNLIGLDYERSGDKLFINNLLDAIERGEFGNLNAEKLFAVGISSGGYMTDRMAKSHGERSWKALAIASASHATCGGPLCLLPKSINKEHPPTLFLHGAKDIVVPMKTMTKYYDFLDSEGIIVKQVIDPEATHQWLDSAPQEVVRWFKRFR